MDEFLISPQRSDYFQGKGGTGALRKSKEATSSNKRSTPTTNRNNGTETRLVDEMRELISQYQEHLALLQDKHAATLAENESLRKNQSAFVAELEDLKNNEKDLFEHLECTRVLQTQVDQQTDHIREIEAQLVAAKRLIKTQATTIDSLSAQCSHLEDRYKRTAQELKDAYGVECSQKTRAEDELKQERDKSALLEQHVAQLRADREDIDTCRAELGIARDKGLLIAIREIIGQKDKEIDRTLTESRELVHAMSILKQERDTALAELKSTEKELKTKTLEAERLEFELERAISQQEQLSKDKQSINELLKRTESLASEQTQRILEKTNEQIKSVRQTYDNEREVLVQQVTMLQTQLASVRNKVLEMGTREFKSDRLMRIIDVWEKQVIQPNCPAR